MKKLLLIIFSLSIIDSVLTYAGIKKGIVVELVPVISNFYNNSPSASVIVDIAATTVLCAVIWIVQKNRKWIIYPLLAILPIKVFAIAMHIRWITTLIS